MMWPLPFVLLVPAGTFIAYLFSAAARAHKRARKAVAELEILDAEVKAQYQKIQDAVSQAGNSFIKEVCSERLRSIQVDELKRHGSGIRLQALKDAGFRNVADLQGRSAEQLSQIRGVGPKSASMIVWIVSRLISESNALPIRLPTPPFASGREHELLQAVYRDCWFEDSVAARGAVLDSKIQVFKVRLSQIRKQTRFTAWIWSFGTSATVRSGVEDANNLYQELDADHIVARLRTDLPKRLDDCRTLCSSRIETDRIVEDYKAKQAVYDWGLRKALGHSSQFSQRPKLPAADVAQATQMNSEKKVPEVVPFHPSVSSAAAMTTSTGARFSSASEGSLQDQTAATSLQVKSSEERPVEAHGLALSPIADHNEESLVSVRVSFDARTASIEFALPPRVQTTTASALRWVEKGETVVVQNISISTGLFFLGKSGSGDTRGTIDPTLPAKRGAELPGESRDRYFSYSELSPDQRFQYLNWLSTGATSSDNPGFGMLHFIALESRLLQLNAEGKIPPDSIKYEEILGEIAHMVSLFQKTNGVVTHYARRLIDFQAARSLADGPLPKLPEAWERGYELPSVLLYGLGYLIREKKPIPTDWALRWIYCESTLYLRTPATRCKAEFEKAFAKIYTERYGQGLVIPENKTNLKIKYQPLAYWVGAGSECKFAGIPDVRALTAPQLALREIAEKSTAMVEPYSRFVGRNPDKQDALEARLTLPPALWPETANDTLQEFRTTIVEKLEPIQYREFLERFGCPEEMPASKSTELVRNLQKLCIGFEPDVLSGIRRPQPADIIVLFPLSADFELSRDAPHYRKASLTIALAAIVALADGHASESELTVVDQMISKWSNLHRDLRSRLRAQYRLQIAHPASLSSLKARLMVLSSQDRSDLALSLSQLANADGVVSPSEVKLLEQVYRTLELDPQSLYTQLHGGVPTASEAEVLRKSATGTGVAPFLDAQLISKKRRETNQVSELLAGVFTDDEPEIPPAELKEQEETLDEASGAVLIPGVSGADRPFLELLLQKPVWSRAELVRAAMQMQIMLDGALERINEAALDFSGEPLIEGDDPIYVQQIALETVE